MNNYCHKKIQHKFYYVAFVILFNPVLIVSSYANTGESELMTVNGEVDLIPLLQKINALSKRNEQLKIRINQEINKQDGIIKKITSLTNQLAYKVDSNDSASDDALTVSDFEYVDDKLLQKCNDITLDFSKQLNISESQYIQNLLKNEPLDSEWTSEVSIGINEHVANSFPGTEVVSIECKTSVCDITLKHRDKASRADFNVNFNPDNQWNIIDTQSKDDVLSQGSYVSIQIAHDGADISQ